MVADVKSARRAVVMMVLVLLSLGPSSCSSSSSSGSKQITIKNFAFRPHDLVVKTGDTITVANHDTSLHGVLADDQSFGARSISPRLSTRFSLAKAGTFSYHCTFHASMTGVITVKG
jgi:plastocyanin